VVKVTNLCPYGGNEQWCAYDINSYGYEAHFDLMDYNMAGLISSTMGWDNPEVTYEEVNCATNGFDDWDCQCKDYGTANSTQTSSPAATSAPTTSAPSTPEPSKAATSAPTSAPTTQTPTDAATPAPTQQATQAPTQKATQKPTHKATHAPTHEATRGPTDSGTPAPTEESTPAPTEESTPAPTEESTPAPTEAATTAPTDAPTESGSADPIEVQIQINGGSNAWWMGFSVVTPAISDIAKVEIKDQNQAIPSWAAMTYEGNAYWNMYSINPSSEMKAPLSLRITSSCGTVVTANNVITTFQAATIDTGVAL
jgi:hypothetical protein